MGTKRIVATTAGLALVGLALSGCVIESHIPDEGLRVTVTAQPKVQADAGSTTQKGSKGDGSTATESAKGSKKATGPVKSDYWANDSGPRLTSEDLVADSGTTYLKANDGNQINPIDVGGPWLTRYVIDGDEFSYENVVCIGRAPTKVKATGRVKEGQVVWDGGVDPWGGPYGTSDLEVSGSTATLHGGGDVEAEKVTADGVDDVKAQMRKLCQNAKPDPEPVGEAFEAWRRHERWIAEDPEIARRVAEDGGLLAATIRRQDVEVFTQAFVDSLTKVGLETVPAEERGAIIAKLRESADAAREHHG
ncbi:hypothetical protein [Brachybacterium kimchii]|uniref:Lipoprotein n=1 Tax=Brachybacterium kimchii TaxID=2942909 RepID=A0ABY4NAF2_9MICO|nr:hypothetical protein [Brachybacterium kimchii]UQN31517.1 hypothetical protein M4486_09685 [Brachybacterium kimchii]